MHGRRLCAHDSRTVTFPQCRTITPTGKNVHGQARGLDYTGSIGSKKAR